MTELTDREKLIAGVVVLGEPTREEWDGFVERNGVTGEELELAMTKIAEVAKSL